MSRLAVIIPAYKASFLKACIDSFAAQSNQDFHLYVFNDASPENIDHIIQPHLSARNISYHKFEENLGGKSLIKHWERCIHKTSEEWVWLFSDDDYVSNDTVELFYRFIKNNSDTDILRFNKTIIDAQNRPQQTIVFPNQESQKDFFKSILLKKYPVSLPEYLFKRSVYTKKKGFVNFDLAWGSDKATWVNYAEKGVLTIPNGMVYYRMSEENISSNTTYSIFKRKLQARFDYFDWILQQKQLAFLFNNQTSDYLARESVLWFIKENINLIPIAELTGIINDINKRLKLSLFKTVLFILKSKFLNG